MALKPAMRAKLALGDLGEPQIIKTLPPSEIKYTMGRLLVRASEFITRTSLDKTQEFEGLSGEFRMIPADPGREPLESTVLWLPEAFHNEIARELRKIYNDQGEKRDPAGIVETAFEVSVIRAKNPQGYSWSFQPLLESK